MDLGFQKQANSRNTFLTIKRLLTVEIFTQVIFVFEIQQQQQQQPVEDTGIYKCESSLQREPALVICPAQGLQGQFSDTKVVHLSLDGNFLWAAGCPAPCAFGGDYFFGILVHLFQGFFYLGLSFFDVVLVTVMSWSHFQKTGQKKWIFCYSLNWNL